MYLIYSTQLPFSFNTSPLTRRWIFPTLEPAQISRRDRIRGLVFATIYEQPLSLPRYFGTLPR